MENYIELPDLNNLDLSGSEWLHTALPSFDFADFTNEITKGGKVFKADNILNALMSVFAEELYSCIKILAVIIAIVLLSAILENLRSSFNRKGSMNTEIIVMALLSGLAGEIFFQCGSYAENVSGDISKIMWAVLPVMTTLSAGAGFVQTGIMTHPVLYFMCNVFAEIFNKILIPLAVSYLSISLADLLTDAIKLEKFRELIRKAYNFILGLVMTFFTGLLGISSFAGVSLDSVGAKGIKFAVSNMVPFVGGSISDAMGSVRSASVLLKNAVGITSMVCILALCIVPIIKIAAVIISIRISAAICEPIASNKTILILSSAADGLSMINAAVIATVMTMIISLAILVGVR